MQSQSKIMGYGLNDKRFLSSGGYRGGRLESILNRPSVMPGQLMIDDLRWS